MITCNNNDYFHYYCPLGNISVIDFDLYCSRLQIEVQGNTNKINKIYGNTVSSVFNTACFK